MALVEKAGIDKHQYLDILTSTLFNAPVYKTYGTLIADRAFEPGGFRRAARPEGYPACIGRRRGIAGALAARQPVARPFPRAARAGRRPARLVGHRRAPRQGCRNRGSIGNPGECLTKCPLTLALSPLGRGDARMTQLPQWRAAASSLSPWGEGWGEGVFGRSTHPDFVL